MFFLAQVFEHEIKVRSKNIVLFEMDVEGVLKLLFNRPIVRYKSAYRIG